MKRQSIYIATVLSIMALVGCGSSSDIITSPTEIDAAPPAIPEDLSGKTGESSVLLMWTPNAINTNIAGYMVYREKSGRVAPLVSSPMAQPWYLDKYPNTNGDNIYRVSCVDLYGNESEYNTITVTINQERDRSREIHPVISE